MNSLYTTLLATIFYICFQNMLFTEAKPFTQDSLGERTKRYITGGYGDVESPIVLNHLLKQPILSFGPWFSPSRSKRFNNEDYSEFNSFYPQPISQRRLKRALRQHKRMLLSL